jgi:hypothetical protein
MKYLFIPILILLISCNSRTSTDKSSTNELKETLDPLVIAESELTSKLSIEDFLDESLIERLVQLETDSLKIKHYEDFFNSESLTEIDDSLILSFYDLPELQPFNDYYGFIHYYFAYGDIIENKFLPIYVLNSDWETSQSIDVFLIDTNKRATGFFQASSIELQPSYGISSSGYFKSENVYTANFVDYTVEGEKIYKKTGIFEYVIDSEGNVNRTDISKSFDTLDIEPDYQ